MRKTLKIVVALVVLLYFVGDVSAQGRPFITKWKGKAGVELKIPIVGTYKMVIKNASGNEKINQTVSVSDGGHPYAFTPTDDGIYTVEAGPAGVKYMEMTGESIGGNWVPASSNEALLEVIQFGTVEWESMERMFRGCANMTFAAGIDTPDLRKVMYMSNMFYGCSAFNQPLNHWNVSNVTNMESMFDDCAAFNQPLDKWNVGNVTDMNFMFYNCAKFNQPLEDWNVGNVTDMQGMFDGCSKFNQPLEDWNVGNVTNMEWMFTNDVTFNQPLDNWDVSKVTNMGGMFRDCSAFNQPLEQWNVGNVTDMQGMFNGCSKFNQPLNNWNVSNVTSMQGMFDDCSAFNQPLGKWNIKTVVGGLGTTAMSVDNYSKTLVGWAEGTTISGLEFDVNELVYNAEGKAARETLIARGWKFNGDKEEQDFGLLTVVDGSGTLTINGEQRLSNVTLSSKIEIKATPAEGKKLISLTVSRDSYPTKKVYVVRAIFE